MSEIAHHNKRRMPLGVHVLEILDVPTTVGGLVGRYFLMMEPLGPSASSSKSTVPDQDWTKPDREGHQAETQDLRTSPGRSFLQMCQQANSYTHELLLLSEFIHSLHKYLPRVCCETGTVLGAGNTG